jgi:hypothetical protein
MVQGLLKALVSVAAFIWAAAALSQEKTAIPPEQLDSLVAPIALYPDPLLAQTLAASTYPLEVVQLQQWLAKNPTLKDQALADAVAKQPWDPAIQAMAALPEVVKRLADDIRWTTDLGNAFLTQQADVMAAVQRMRKKAQDAGKLTTTDKQKVETQVVENKSVIVVEQADPQVVYVPIYDPVVVYGPPVYPYPPIYYPPYPYGAVAVSFGVGVAMGAFWGGGWGWGCSWGHSDIDINVNNRFSRNSVVQGGGRWQHDGRHRGGTPYPNRGTADRFGGMTAGDSMARREASARDQLGRQGGDLQSARGGDRSLDSPGGDRGFDSPGGGDRGFDSPGGGDRSFDSSRGGDRAPGADGGFGGPVGDDRIGSRDLSRSGGSGDRAFDGGSRGYNGSFDRAAGSRGASSMGGRSMGGRGGMGGGRRR